MGWKPPHALDFLIYAACGPHPARDAETDFRSALAPLKRLYGKLGDKERRFVVACLQIRSVGAEAARKALLLEPRGHEAQPDTPAARLGPWTERHWQRAAAAMFGRPEVGSLIQALSVLGGLDRPNPTLARMQVISLLSEAATFAEKVEALTLLLKVCPEIVRSRDGGAGVGPDELDRVDAMLSKARRVGVIDRNGEVVADVPPAARAVP